MADAEKPGVDSRDERKVDSWLLTYIDSFVLPSIIAIQ